MHRAAATLESVWDATGTEGGRGRARIVSQKLDEIFCVDSFYLNSFEMKSSLERIRRRDDTRERNISEKTNKFEIARTSSSQTSKKSVPKNSQASDQFELNCATKM